ncbi:MAG: sigma-70 family RNA polymerase sigma factor [Verrucomicrobiota bacterium]
MGTSLVNIRLQVRAKNTLSDFLAGGCLMGEMQSRSDAELLRDYAERGLETAFAEIVTRHTNLVYSAALRQVYSPDLARDVTQSVFTDLARKIGGLSGRLSPEASLVGWLYRGTRFAARDLNRGEIRRTQRERQAMEQLHPAPEAPPEWEQLRPALDDAMAELDDTDRDAILLRYFRNHDLRTVGATLGMSDDAAQKRVSRAVERLRELFAKRGVTVGASGLAVVISANAVQAAPVGLALTISTAAALTGTTLATTATVTTTKAIAMTALQKTLVAATIAVLAGTGIYEARQASQLREQLHPLQQTQLPSSDQVRQLQIEFREATNRLASLQDENDRLNRNAKELLKLRSEVGLLRNQMLVLKSTQQSVTNQMQFRFPYLPRESWTEKGTDEPLNTILTMFWALKQADENKLEQLVLRLNASQSLDQLTLPKQDWSSISGVQILNTFEFFPAGGAQANVEVIFEKERSAADSQSQDKPEKDLEARRWVLTKTNNQWLIMGRR